MSQSFTNLGKMIQKVSKTKVDGITLFNRFYRPDIDLDSNELISAQVFSTPLEYVIPLQWTALMSNLIKTPLVASTGIHDGASFVKLLLAGSSANYVVSSLYKNGFEVIPQILTYLENYLRKNKYRSVKEIIGKLNQLSIKNPKYYERAQFMKYFSDRADVV
jgi:dihydroorotate dehydrogenase (fumarate)